MKISHALMMAGALALVACGGEEVSGSNNDKTSYDCTTSGVVKVLAPEGGETFSIGDEIKVVYGSDIVGSGYRFVYATSDEDEGIDLLDGSAGPEEPDGKTCYTQKVKLTKTSKDGEEMVKPSKTATIQVVPYEKQSKYGESKTFTVK